ncbi:MAG: response regulator [Cyanobacteria bacterium RM1_2_2]|nr:response regulator [Cyanobacteria bacterium RM1_2_2]
MKRILVIEDDPAISYFIGQCLKLGNYSVLKALDGAVGLSLATGLYPDLVLCDLNLPSLNGLEILKQLRQDATTTQIPFILLTSHTDLQTHENALKLGANVFLSKPVRAKKLLATVQSQLENISLPSAAE